MNEEKLNVVREYLSLEFVGCKIDEKYDFDRGAQTFKIRSGRDLLLLKVSEIFLDDNNQQQIKDHLEKWEVADLLKNNKEFGIFVGSNAPFGFNKFV